MSEPGKEQRRCPSCGGFMPEDRGAEVCINCDDGLRADGGPGLGPDCEFCGELLDVDEEWVLAPGLMPGSETGESTNYDGRDGSGYVHERCLEDDGPDIETDGGQPSTGSDRTQVGHVIEDGGEIDVYAARGNGRKSMGEVPIGTRGWLGNPYPEARHGRETCIEKFREDFEERLAEDEEFREAVRDLAGQTLGCFCQTLDEDGPACHAEVIAEHADRLASIRADGSGEPVTDQYGTIEEHVGTCRTCNRRVVGDGSCDGFESVERELASHIDDGTACHDYSIQAVYQDGGERRVA